MAQEDSQKEAQQYQQLAQTIRMELSSPLADFTTKQREARKLIQKTIQDAYNQRQLQVHYVLRARDKYNNECMRISQLKQDKENQKAALSRAAASAKSLHAEYESSLSTAQDTVEVWNREWQSCCNNFQNLEEERINFLRESLSQFTYLQMTYTKAQLARWEGLIQLVNDWDGREEIDTYVTECGTGREVPDTMDYLVMYEQQEHEKSTAPSENKEIIPISPTLMRQDSVTIPVTTKVTAPAQTVAPRNPSTQTMKVKPKEVHASIRDSHKAAEAQPATRDIIKEIASPASNQDLSKQSEVQETSNQSEIRSSPISRDSMEQQPIKRTIEVAPEPTPQRTHPDRDAAKEPMYSSSTMRRVARQNSIQASNGRPITDNEPSPKGQQERGSLVRMSSTRPIKLDLNRMRGSLSRNNTVISTVSSTDTQASAHTSLEKMLERFQKGEIGAGSQRLKDSSSERETRRQRIGTLRSRHDNNRISLQSRTSWQSLPPPKEESDYNYTNYSTQSTSSTNATTVQMPNYSTNDPYQRITNLRNGPQEVEEDKYKGQLVDHDEQHDDEHNNDERNDDFRHDTDNVDEGDADHPTADLESQLDDMISLLNDGIDYQRDLMSRQSSPDSIPPAETEPLEEIEVDQPSQAVHYEKAIMWVQALFDYQAEDDDELSFEAGDLIAVLSTFDDGWWQGELWDAETNQSIAIGTIPSNFVEEVDVS
ncbi:formin-binding protein [Umbelopsis sp. WA50703]